MKLKAIVVVVVRRRRMHSEITSGQGEKRDQQKSYKIQVSGTLRSTP